MRCRKMGSALFSGKIDEDELFLSLIHISIVSIDVSNGNSHFQCFTQRGTKMGKVHRISHTVEGFNFLKSKIEELEKKTNEEVVAVYEATGVYTKP